MIFQTLDNKGECVGVFADGELFFGELPDGLTRTWSYAPYLDEDVEYASLYCQGLSPDDVCPDSLKGEWTSVSKRMKAFLKSLKISKVSLEEVCFFDLVPERFLKEYFDLKSRISEHVFKTYAKPDNYDFLSELTKMITEVGENRLNLDFQGARDSLDTASLRTYKKVQKALPYVRYNVFGTKTGRLSTKKRSFPVLNLDRRHRSIVKPDNDCFIELDFNAAELRTLLSLSGHKQPSGDLHEWNAKNIYGGLVTRDEAKKRIFSWLYNPSLRVKRASQFYSRDKILTEYWDGQVVRTPFGREIKADKDHALSYLLQSTCSDMVLRQAIKIHNLLKGRKSKLIFIVHDSIVIDCSAEDKQILDKLVSCFSETELGKFKVGVQMGKDYGSMREIKWTQS